MGELGRYPLYIEILSNCTKYLQHIYKSDGTLLASALQENMILNNNRKSCWLSSIHCMLEQLGISCDNILAENLPSIVYNELKRRFTNLWQNNLSECVRNEKGKLRTYGLYKTRLIREKYFSISKPEVLKCFTNFRISSHKLEIETGRYRDVPAVDRKCKLCASDSVEDEIHFIFECSTYKLYRQVFISHISKENKNFSSLSNKNKFIWLMSNESSDIIYRFAEYIFKCYMKRSNVVSGCS